MHVLRSLGWLVLVTGLVMQWGLKDRSADWALLFYGMPKPCLMVLAGTLAWLSPRRTWTRGLAMALTTALALAWIVTSWRQAPTMTAKPAAAQEITLLYWNLCRPAGYDADMVALMKEWKPDLAAFVEPGRQVEAQLPRYRQELPGYEPAWMPRGILWFSRLPSRYRERGKLDFTGAYATFEVQSDRPTFPVVVADVHPHLFRSRRQQLIEVLAQAKDRQDAILVGDFNTPLESVHLEGIRQRFVEAHEVAGSGFKETWPSGLPLLSIDHVWVGPAWQVVEARKIWCLTGSDHAALWVRLRR